MKRNKLLIILLAAALLLSVVLTGCGGGEQGDNDPDYEDADTADDNGENTDRSKEPSEDEESAGNDIPIIQGQELSATAEYDPDNPQYGTGLADAEETSQLDDNPTRAVRRSTKPIRFIPMTMLDGTPLGEEYFYYRSLLDGDQVQVYDFIREEVIRGTEEIQMVLPVSADSIFEFYCMVLYDDPSLFYATTSANYSTNQNNVVTVLRPQYNQCIENIEGYRKYITDATADAMAAMWNMDNDLARVKYAHDYLTHTIDYVAGPLDQSIYSAFVQGQTVCAGYSRAMQYLMLKMGIRCSYIRGYAGENHAWNILELDGETYAMDVTWDDPIGAGPDDYRYQFFNVTDYVLQQNNHERRDLSLSLPAANATRLNYQNAFGGNAYGTDFGAFGGELPAQPQGPVVPDEPTGNWWENPEDGDTPPDEEGGGSGGDTGYGWWNVLDESWTKDDWTLEDDGIWSITDESTSSIYLYNEELDEFGVIDMETDEMYSLNMETGEWELVEE